MTCPASALSQAAATAGTHAIWFSAAALALAAVFLAVALVMIRRDRVRQRKAAAASQKRMLDAVFFGLCGIPEEISL